MPIDWSFCTLITLMGMDMIDVQACLKPQLRQSKKARLLRTLMWDMSRHNCLVAQSCWIRSRCSHLSRVDAYLRLRI